MTHVVVSGRVLDKQVGGNTRYARAVYSRLADHGVSHSVSRPARTGSGRLRSLLYAVHEGVVMPRSERDADVIHFPADTGAWSAGWRPIVGTIHGLAALHVPGVRGPVSQAVWDARVARLARSATAIVTVSESSARDLVRRFPEARRKVFPIHHGIDHQRFRVGETKAPPPLLASIGVTGPYFAYVGNIEPRKNLDELTEAASTVFSRTGIPTVVSGAPAWGHDRVMAAMDQTPGVHYVGRLDDADMIELLRNALAFCFPSRYEGFGFPVLEAQACGTPVICSDRGSLPEIVGDSALVLEDISAASIASAMLRLCDDESARRDLTRSGLANVQRFTWDASARLHAEVFAAAARRGRRTV